MSSNNQNQNPNFSANVDDVAPSSHSNEILVLSTFLKSKYPKCIPVPLTKNTKMPLWTFAFDKVTDEQLWDKWEKNGINRVGNGEVDVGLSLRGDLIVVDVDNKFVGESIGTQEGFKDTVCVETKKGFHFYFEKSEDCANWTKMVRPYKDKFDIDCEIDIITTEKTGTGGIIVLPPSKNKNWIRPIGEYDILPLPKWFIDKHNELMEGKTNGNVGKVVKTEKGDVEFVKLRKAVLSLNPSRAKDYNDWKDCIFAIHNISFKNGYAEEGSDLIHEFSKMCPEKYNERNVDTFIRYATFRKDGFGMGSVMTWLRRDNKEVYDEIMKKETNQVQINGYAFQEDKDDTVQGYNYNCLLDTEGRTYDQIKKVFESHNFKITNPVSYVEKVKGGHIVLRGKQDTSNRYENLRLIYEIQTPRGTGIMNTEFVKMWFKDPKMRTYEKVDFLPPPVKVPQNIYNMWNGFAIERENVVEDGDCQFIVDHMLMLFNNDESVLKYVLDWLANIIQNPGNPSHIAIALYSEKEGAGKGVIVEFVRKVIGFEDLTYETCDPENDIFGKFSNGRAFKLLVTVDETRSKSHFDYADFFKNYITSSTMRFEEKGLKPMMINNYNNWLFLTNNPYAFKVSESDRRYVLIECNNDMCGNADYFSDLVDKSNDVRNQKAFFDFLKGRDIENVKWAKDRPITAFYKEVQSLSTDITKLFFKDFVFTCSKNKDGEWVGYGNELFKEFLDWGKDTNRSIKMTTTMFGRLIKKVDGVVKQHTMYGERYIISTNTVLLYLQKNGVVPECLINIEEEDNL